MKSSNKLFFFQYPKGYQDFLKIQTSTLPCKQIPHCWYLPQAIILWQTYLRGSHQSRSQSFVPPWPAVRKREPWEQPFQACAIAWNRCRLRLRSELDNQNSVISHCYFKMDAPKALVFRPLVKGNEALGTRLESHIPPLLLPDPPLRPRHLLVHKITFIQYLENLIFQGLWPPCFLPASDP